MFKCDNSLLMHGVSLLEMKKHNTRSSSMEKVAQEFIWPHTVLPGRFQWKVLLFHKSHKLTSVYF